MLQKNEEKTNQIKKKKNKAFFVIIMPLAKLLLL